MSFLPAGLGAFSFDDDVITVTKPIQQQIEQKDLKDKKELKELKEQKELKARDTKPGSFSSFTSVMNIFDLTEDSEEIKEIKEKMSQQLEERTALGILGSYGQSNRQQAQGEDLDSLSSLNIFYSFFYNALKKSEFAQEKNGILQLLRSLKDLTSICHEKVEDTYRLQLEQENAFDFSDTPKASTTLPFKAKIIIKRLKELKIGESLTLFGGAPNQDGQNNLLLFIIVRTEIDNYSLAIVNSGKGVQFHPSVLMRSRESLKNKKLPVLIKENLSIAEITNENCWKSYVEICDGAKDSSNYIYHNWLNGFSENFIQSALTTTMKYNFEPVTLDHSSFSSVNTLLLLVHLFFPNKFQKKRMKLHLKFSQIDKTLSPVVQAMKKDLSGNQPFKTEVLLALQEKISTYTFALQDFLRSVNKYQNDFVATAKDIAAFQKEVKSFSDPVVALLEDLKEIDKMIQQRGMSQRLSFKGLRGGDEITLSLEQKEKASNFLTSTTETLYKNSSAEQKEKSEKAFANVTNQILKDLIKFSGTISDNLPIHDCPELQTAHFNIVQFLANLPDVNSTAWNVDSRVATQLMRELTKIQLAFYHTLRFLTRVDCHIILSQKMLRITEKLFIKVVGSRKKYAKEETEIDSMTMFAAYFSRFTKQPVENRPPQPNKFLSPEHFLNSAHLFSQDPAIETETDGDRPNESLFPLSGFRNHLNNISKSTLPQPLFILPKSFTINDNFDSIENEINFIRKLLASNPTICEEIEKAIFLRKGQSVRTVVLNSEIIAYAISNSTDLFPEFACLRIAVLTTFLLKEGVGHRSLITEPLKGLVQVAESTSGDYHYYLKTPSLEHSEAHFTDENHFETQSGIAALTYKDFIRIMPIEETTQNEIMYQRSTFNNFPIDADFIIEFKLIRSSDNKATEQIYNAISLFTKHAGRLVNPTYQFLFEAVIFEGNFLKESLKRDPTLADQLAQLIKGLINMVNEQADLSSTLFFLRMGSILSLYAPAAYPDLISVTDILLKSSNLTELERTLILRERLAHWSRKFKKEDVAGYLIALAEYRNLPVLPKEFKKSKLDYSINYLHYQINKTILAMDAKEVVEKFGSGFSYNYPLIKGRKQDKDYVFNVEKGTVLIDQQMPFPSIPYIILINPTFQALFPESDLIRDFKIDHSSYHFTYNNAKFIITLSNGKDLTFQHQYEGETYTYFSSLEKAARVPIRGTLWLLDNRGIVIDDSDHSVKYIYVEKNIYSKRHDCTRNMRLSLQKTEGDLSEIRNVLTHFDDKALFWIKSSDDRVFVIELPTEKMTLQVKWDHNQIEEIQVDGSNNFCLKQYIHQKLPKPALVLEERQTKAKKLRVKGEVAEYNLDEDHNLVGQANQQADYYLSNTYLAMFQKRYDVALKFLKKGESLFGYTKKEIALLYKILSTSSVKELQDPCASALRVRAFHLLCENKTYLLGELDPKKFNEEDLYTYLSNQSHIHKRFRLTDQEIKLVSENLSNDSKILADTKHLLSMKLEISSEAPKTLTHTFEFKEKALNLLKRCNMIRITKLGDLPSAIDSEAFIIENFFGLYRHIIIEFPFLSSEKSAILLTFLKLSPSPLAKLLLALASNESIRSKFPEPKLCHTLYQDIVAAVLNLKESEISIPVTIVPIAKTTTSEREIKISSEAAALSSQKLHFALIKADVPMIQDLYKQTEIEIKSKRDSADIFESLNHAKKVNDSKRAVLHVLEEFENDLKCAIDLPEYDFTVNQEKLCEWKKIIESSCAELNKKLETMRKTISDAANKQPTSSGALVRSQNNIYGNVNKKLELDHLILIYLQGKGELTPAYAKEYTNLNSNLSVEDISSLHKMVKEYLLTATHAGKLTSILNSISQFEKGEKEFSEILKEARTTREYDVDLYPHYLVFEYHLNKNGVILRKDQIEALHNLRQGSSIVLQLEPGFGKTEVLACLNAFEKADGKNLSIFMVPKELLNTISSILKGQLGEIFCKRLYYINWKDTSAAGLKNIYARLEEVTANKGILITTPDQINEFFLDMNEAMHSRIESVEDFIKIKNFLKSKGLVTIDEVDQSLPVSSDFRKTAGNPKKTSPQSIELSLFLYKILFKDLQNSLSFACRPSNGKPFGNAFESATREQLVEASLKWISGKNEKWSKVIKEQYSEIINFINSVGALPAIGIPELSEMICMAEEALQILPSALSVNHHVRYGLFQEKDGQSFSLMAGPFDNSLPIYGSRFSNTLERIFLTIQSYLASKNGLKAILTKEISRLKEKAREDNLFSVQLDQTAGYLEFLERILIVNRNQFTVDKFLNFNEKEIDELVEKVWKDIDHLFLILKHFVLSQDENYNQVFVQDSSMLFQRFQLVIGFSGTPSRDLLGKFDSLVRDKGTDGKFFNLFRKGSFKERIILKDGLNNQELVKRLFHGQHHAVMDAAALLRYISSFECAVNTLASRNDLDGVDFFDANSNNMFLQRGASIPVPLNSVQTGQIRKLVYYDQPRCIGVNKQLPKKCSGIVTMTHSSMFSKMKQASMRLRQLGNKQTIQIAICESSLQVIEKALDKNVNKLTDVDLMLYTKIKEAEKAAEDCWLSFQQSIRMVVILAVEEAIEKQLKQNKSYAILSRLLVTVYQDTFYREEHLRFLVRQQIGIELMVNEVIDNALFGLKDYEEYFSLRTLKETMIKISERFLNPSNPLLNEYVITNSSEFGKEEITQVRHLQRNQVQETTTGISKYDEPYIIRSNGKLLFDVSKIEEQNYLEDGTNEFFDEVYADLIKNPYRTPTGYSYFGQLKAAFKRMGTGPFLPVGKVLAFLSELNTPPKLSFNSSFCATLDFCFSSVVELPFGNHQKPFGTCLFIRSRENPNFYKFILLSGRESEAAQNVLGSKSLESSKRYEIALCDPRNNRVYCGKMDFNDPVYKNMRVRYLVLSGCTTIPQDLQQTVKEWFSRCIKMSYQLTEDNSENAENHRKAAQELEDSYLAMMKNRPAVTKAYGPFSDIYKAIWDK